MSVILPYLYSKFEGLKFSFMYGCILHLFSLQKGLKGSYEQRAQKAGITQPRQAAKFWNKTITKWQRLASIEGPLKQRLILIKLLNQIGTVPNLFWKVVLVEYCHH